MRWRRRFGWAAALGPRDRVFLVMGSSPTQVHVCVNGVSLSAGGPPAAPARFDVTALLQSRNEAVIEMVQGNVPDVRLEIHSG
jgi:hypothetical protein